MVTSIKPKLSLAEFLELPETKPYSEYINGQVYQKEMPQGQHSLLQSKILNAINQIGESSKTAYAFPELRCTFSGISIVPDIAVLEWSRIPLNPDGTIANRILTYPDWIIEIVSLDQSPNSIIKKIAQSLAAGTTLGWLIDPADQSVSIFEPSKVPYVIADNDIIPGHPMLANFSISVNQLFGWLKLG